MSSDEIEQKKAELPAEKSELELLNERLLRALADFDNYKKRVALEQDQFVKYANEAIIKELIPSLDGMAKALETAEALKVNDNLVKGLALVKRQMIDTLTKFGVEEIEALDKPYDPNLHEAIMQKDSDKPANVIVEEVQKGFTLHGRVIRPSMVIVSKKGEK